MEFQLDPPRGVEHLRLGMTADTARAALSELGQLNLPGHGQFYAHRPSCMGISVGFGTGGQVNSIEIWRPDADDTVHYQDLDLFGLPALQVAAELSRRTLLVPADDDASFTAPELLLALWRPFAADDDPEEEQGYYFSSVLVARPGYYDTPAQAAQRLAAGGQPGY